MLPPPMRLPPCSPCCAFVILLAACGADPVPPTVAPVAVEAGDPAKATPVSADPGLGPVAARLLDGTASTEDRQRAAQSATNTVLELLAAAAAGDAPTRGRAPAAIQALGTAALPGLAQGLAHRDVTCRRIAVNTLLQLSDSLHTQGTAEPVLAALAAARGDQDPAVRAAAEFAYKRATGDTSAIDQSRAAHEAALRSGR